MQRMGWFLVESSTSRSTPNRAIFMWHSSHVLMFVSVLCLQYVCDMMDHTWCLSHKRSPVKNCADSPYFSYMSVKEIVEQCSKTGQNVTLIVLQHILSQWSVCVRGVTYGPSYCEAVLSKLFWKGSQQMTSLLSISHASLISSRSQGRSKRILCLASNARDKFTSSKFPAKSVPISPNCYKVVLSIIGFPSLEDFDGGAYGPDLELQVKSQGRILEFLYPPLTY